MLLLFFYLRAERYYCVVGVRLIETLDFAIVQKKKENLHVPIVPEIHTVYTHYMDTGPIESRKKKFGALESNRKKESSFFRSRTANAHVLFFIFIYLFHQVFICDNNTQKNTQLGKVQCALQTEAA